MVRLNISIALHIAFSLVSVLPAQPTGNAVAQSRAFMNTAMKQYVQKNYAGALQNFTEALRLRPDHPSLKYNVAAMQSLTGNTESALKELSAVARMGLLYSPEHDSDFVSLWNTPRFQNIVNMFRHNSERTGTPDVVFTMKERGLVTEGIAYDSASGSFFIGCVRTRCIIERTKLGKERFFSRASDSLWGVLGMKVDNSRRLLWAVTSTLPQMEGYSSEMGGRTAVVLYDLQTGRLIKKFEPDGSHTFGDLTLDHKGNVYVTDSRSPDIYRILLHSDTLELFYSSPEFVSLQGISFSDDDSHLYVSDYARGIFVIDPDTRNARLTPPLNDETLLTLDGLYYYKGTLIASQNNVNPNRIVRIQLSPDEEFCTRLLVLEANNSACAEPTLGTVIGNEFYFIGTSGWSNVSDAGIIDPPQKLQRHNICKIPL